MFNQLNKGSAFIVEGQRFGAWTLSPDAGRLALFNDSNFLIDLWVLDDQTQLARTVSPPGDGPCKMWDLAFDMQGERLVFGCPSGNV